MLNHVCHLSKTLGSLSSFDLEAMAKSCGWKRREGGKIAPAEFCAAMLGATNTGEASLRIVAFLLGSLLKRSVSKQAVQKKVNAKASDLLEALLAKAISSKAGLSPAASALGFKRVLLQDSTSIALPQHLLEAFKGAKNAQGERAGAKVQASFELLSGRFANFEVKEHREPDQAYSREGAEGLGEGDLLLRDLGYFCIDAFRQIEESGADALSRWQPKVQLLDPDSKRPFDLLELLKGSSKVDRQVLVGGRKRFPMRLVAFPVGEEVARKRRRKLKASMNRRGRSATRSQLELQGWQIYLTTCDPQRLPLEAVFELYSQRWAIEILFKAFKSHMFMDRIPHSCGKELARCLILSNLIRIALGCVLAAPIRARSGGAGAGHLSILKLFSLMQALGVVLDESYFDTPANLDNFVRHSCYDKRKRRNLPQRLEALG